MSKKLGSMMLALACWTGLGDPSLATATTLDGASIPVVLTGDTDETGYIQPICMKCKRLTVARQTSSTAVLGLVYFDDTYASFSGAILLTLSTSDDREIVVTIDDVLLVQGQAARWTLEAGSSWSWDDVEMVWIELVPGE